MDLKKLLQKLHKSVYDKNYTCYLCRGEVFQGETFCRDCQKSLPYNFTFCPKCGRKITQMGYCMDCRSSLLAVDKARSLFRYECEAINLIHAFKKGNPYMAEGIAQELLPIVEREFFDADFITFVPMTKAAEDRRGYNQSALLAHTMSAFSGILLEELFEKMRDTSEQKSLTRKERSQNLHGAFRLKQRAICKGKTVLIIDDTLTTGATVGELSRLLYGAKVKKVYLLTVASVVLQK